MTVGDRTLTCRDCGKAFVFTAGEQAFYAERGFVDPARCPECRTTRRQANMNGGNAGVAGASRAERRLFSAVCAECGQDTQVPFEPRLGRPVYCRDCYQRIRT